MLSDSEFLKRLKEIYPSVLRHLDMLVLRHWSKKISNAKNILNKSGKKFYSQNDEDGILLEILKRIKKNNGSFIEIGVGGFVTNNGTENNTIILLMLGWKGIWIDSQKIDINLNENSRLKFIKEFTGTNAFFINNKHNDRFSDIPTDINDIYYAPDYNWFTQTGHPTSTKTIEYFANKK